MKRARGKSKAKSKTALASKKSTQAPKTSLRTEAVQAKAEEAETPRSQLPKFNLVVRPPAIIDADAALPSFQSIVRYAFELDTLCIPLDRILPSRPPKGDGGREQKYATILASVREVGLVEPLAVCRQPGGNFLLLDGHLRVRALRELGRTEATCLVSLEDEALTWDVEVNHIPPVQAARMIQRARDAGVPDTRLAAALQLDVQTLRDRQRSVSYLCPEALELLRNRPMPWAAFTPFRRVTPVRQIEMAELMIAAGNFSFAYAQGLAEVTRPEQRVEAEVKSSKVSAQDLERIEAEVRSVEQSVLTLDDRYGQNMLDLTVARTYLKRLLGSARIVRYLASRHPEILGEFQRIVDAETMEM